MTAAPTAATSKFIVRNQRLCWATHVCSCFSNLPGATGAFANTTVRYSAQRLNTPIDPRKKSSQLPAVKIGMTHQPMRQLDLGIPSKGVSAGLCSANALAFHGFDVACAYAIKILAISSEFTGELCPGSVADADILLLMAM